MKNKTRFPGIATEVVNLPSKYYMLGIGIDNYEDDDFGEDLDFAVDEVISMAYLLRDLYGFQEPIILTNEQATKSNIHDALVKFMPEGKTPLNNDHALLIYFAGHGNASQGDLGYFACHDNDSGNTINWYSHSDFRDQLKSINARHILLIANSCYAGNFSEEHSKLIDECSPQVELFDQRSLEIITSGSKGKKVFDNSSFALTLRRALQYNKDSLMSGKSLYKEICGRVLTEDEQKPTYSTIDDENKEPHRDSSFIFRCSDSVDMDSFYKIHLSTNPSSSSNERRTDSPTQTSTVDDSRSNDELKSSAASPDTKASGIGKKYLSLSAITLLIATAAFWGGLWLNGESDSSSAEAEQGSSNRSAIVGASLTADIPSSPCPSIPGINLTHIESQSIKPHSISRMTRTEYPVALAPGHIAGVLADGDEINVHTADVIPASRLVNEFCIMPEQFESSGGSVSYNRIMDDMSELKLPKGWELSLPTLWELVAASVYLFSRPDQELYRTYMTSLRDDNVEWGRDINRLCPEGDSLILGPQIRDNVPIKPFHAYCQNQNSSGTGSSVYRYRLIARKIN